MKTFDRRRILNAAFCAPALLFSVRAADAKPFDLATALGQAKIDPNIAIESTALKEYGFRQDGPTIEQRRGNSTLPRRWSSEKAISADAVSLITAFEVTNKTVYDARYSHPYWPRGQSGVTVGIGYDLGYQQPSDIRSDWLDIAGESVTETLESVVDIKGHAAASAADRIKDTVITWEMAQANFKNILKLYAGETIFYFPNSEKLSPDSFGALVSLVFNRGSSSKKDPNDAMDRRLEIRNIKSLCLHEHFAQIPDEIRRMGRLWLNVPDAHGLLSRRQIEADLFEAGLS